jgi:NADH:ubiquinone oxidoreductase subunit F (NADH-binding)
MSPHTENAKCGKCTTCRNSSLVSVKKPRVLQAVEGGIADDRVLVREYRVRVYWG